ncbi:DNA-binding protein RHL [Trema orientale]|uniref:DNA-binding protein RHL n=1 Tax=Trema orientale TaxID=63057 RepID=A0A2P5D4P5_TREOI|nr:DNA-binding protein RHL [Trema orientale]
MAGATSLKKKRKVGEGGEDANPETTERKRLKNLAFSNNVLSDTPAKPNSTLSPSKMVAKHHGRDIVKKSQRKNRFLFSFPGLLAPIGGGKIGELKDLGTKNPILYLDFPQGRMKLFGTIVYPKNRYLTLQFPRGGKNVMCDDYFDNMIVFSDAWWIGRQAENPEEARLDFPKELNDGQHAEYDFKGGAGGVACIKKQVGHKSGITNIEEQSPQPSLKEDLSEGENKDLMKATPVRHSSRTAGKTFKFTEASSEDDSVASDADVDELEEDKKVKENVGSVVFDVDNDNEEAVEGTPLPVQNQGSAPSGTQSKKQSLFSAKMNKSREDSRSNHGSLVQATISTLFKKVEEKKTPRNPRKVASPKGPKAYHVDSKRKISQDGEPKKKAKVINDKNAGGKGVAKKEVYKMTRMVQVKEDEDDIEEFSSASQDTDGSDEDWAA